MLINETEAQRHERAADRAGGGRGQVAKNVRDVELAARASGELDEHLEQLGLIRHKPPPLVGVDRAPRRRVRLQGTVGREPGAKEPSPVLRCEAFTVAAECR